MRRIVNQIHILMLHSYFLIRVCLWVNKERKVSVYYVFQEQNKNIKIFCMIVMRNSEIEMI